MKAVRFYELDAENKDIAVSQVLNIYQQHGYPSGGGWETEEDVRRDLEQGYLIDDNFSFYLDEVGDVETKIG